MRPGLVVPAVAGVQDERPDWMRVFELRRVRLNVPRVGEVAILTGQRGTVRQEIARTNAQRITRARIGIQLRLIAVAEHTTGIEISH